MPFILCKVTSVKQVVLMEWSKGYWLPIFYQADFGGIRFDYNDHEKAKRAAHDAEITPFKDGHMAERRM